MTQEETEQTIHFILDQQAKNSVDISMLKDAQSRTDSHITALTEIVASLTESVRTMEVQFEIDRKEFREVMTAARDEVRDAINNLIIANEVTRDLANKIGELAVNTSKRSTLLEQKES